MPDGYWLTNVLLELIGALLGHDNLITLRPAGRGVFGNA